MSMPTLDLFTSPPEDLEIGQYHVLQGLKDCHERFAQNKLYPELSDLIHLLQSLEGILDAHAEMDENLAGDLEDVDLEQGALIRSAYQSSLPELDKIIELTSWAVPHIQESIVEGATIVDFVDDNMSITSVGLIPMYKQEGYWFVPDLRTELLHLLRYELALYSTSKERFRTLKTNELESLDDHQIRHSPESVKLHLIEKYHDLPNPATFNIEVDIDFPYQETVLPIAKRKLMRYLVS